MPGAGRGGGGAGAPGRGKLFLLSKGLGPGVPADPAKPVSPEILTFLPLSSSSSPHQLPFPFLFVNVLFANKP